MANKTIFPSLSDSGHQPPADTVNLSGMPAYRYDARQRLAQIAMTGTFNEGYYGGGKTQVTDLIDATEEVDAEYIARSAIYALSLIHI